MSLLVACATRKELAAALAYAAPPPLPEQGRPTRARIFDRDCLLLVTGVGPLAAAVHIARALGGRAHADDAPTGVLCLGVAGAYDPSSLPIKSLAAVSEARFADFGLATETGIDPRGIGFSQGSLDGRAVYDSLPLDPVGAARAMDLRLDPSWPRLPCLTVCAASGTPGTAAARAHLCCAMEDMEGFAAAYAAAAASLPCLGLRAVSNRVGARPPEGWDLDGALAALGEAFAALMARP
ncbi:futalosine nucleosidase [Desulfovibrio sp. X2]|uniref:futalosine hydrolase n=1 Tax=Desulfovibrio sp. X2 TaxID=941449 RepID=UPI000358B086|nr:futalosine hydrolase [Desulfovibrio sp. X2]EPR44731.1 futalosine nucleosidase [Desulfovibrio sp. X2]